MPLFQVPYRAFGLGLKDDSKVYSALVKAPSASEAACLCVRAYPFAVAWGYPEVLVAGHAYEADFAETNQEST